MHAPGRIQTTSTHRITILKHNNLAPHHVWRGKDPNTSALNACKLCTRYSNYSERSGQIIRLGGRYRVPPPRRLLPTSNFKASSPRQGLTSRRGFGVFYETPRESTFADENNSVMWEMFLRVLPMNHDFHSLEWFEVFMRLLDTVE